MSYNFAVYNTKYYFLFVDFWQHIIKWKFTNKTGVVVDKYKKNFLSGYLFKNKVNQNQQKAATTTKQH